MYVRTCVFFVHNPWKKSQSCFKLVPYILACVHTYIHCLLASSSSHTSTIKSVVESSPRSSSPRYTYLVPSNYLLQDGCYCLQPVRPSSSFILEAAAAATAAAGVRGRSGRVCPLNIQGHTQLTCCCCSDRVSIYKGMLLVMLAGSALEVPAS